MGLRKNDLQYTVYDIISVDEYSSKMGDPEDIVTVSFEVSSSEPATDLADFLEKGYEFVLDADVSPGEVHNGRYLVFVELQRDRDVLEHIIKILDDVKKLTGIADFKFRYYKQFRSHDVTYENLKQRVPINSDDYRLQQKQSHLVNLKDFFAESLISSIELNESRLTLSKPYADPISFEILDFDRTSTVIDSIDKKSNILESYPKIIYLTKYLGEYHISSFEDELVLENNGYALRVKQC